MLRLLPMTKGATLGAAGVYMASKCLGVCCLWPRGRVVVFAAYNQGGGCHVGDVLMRSRVRPFRVWFINVLRGRADDGLLPMNQGMIVCPMLYQGGRWVAVSAYSQLGSLVLSVVYEPRRDCMSLPIIKGRVFETVLNRAKLSGCFLISGLRAVVFASGLYLRGALCAALLRRIGCVLIKLLLRGLFMCLLPI
jgi:hypothetical protein